MKKSFFSIIGVLFLASFMFIACEETEGVANPYTDWEARNQAYIDSIAEVAKNNPSEWKVIRSYKLPSSFNDVGAANSESEYLTYTSITSANFLVSADFLITCKFHLDAKSPSFSIFNTA